MRIFITFRAKTVKVLDNCRMHEKLAGLKPRGVKWISECTVGEQSLNSCRKATCLTAPAKLNLGLQITGRRADNFHLLYSLFWPIDLCDKLAIEEDDSNRVKMGWAPNAPVPSPLPDIASNLVHRTLEKASAICGKFWKVTVEKSIPIGGGLGGGSADAGTLLRYFIKTYPRWEDKFSALAPELGADVPFFLSPVPSWVRGIGEKIAPADFGGLVGLRFLVVLLPEPTNTARVFSIYHAASVAFSRENDLPDPSNPAEMKSYLRRAQNDLEYSAGSQYPLISEVVKALQQYPNLYAGLSGTGSTCFSIYDNDSDLEKTFKGLAQYFRQINCKSLKVSTFQDK